MTNAFAPRVLFACLLLSTSTLCAQEAADKPKAKPKAAPNPALAKIEDDPKLPRVLLIGDSISIGYTLPVRELLKDAANVHRIPTNGGPTSNGIKNIETWLGTGKWDVIHFNWGLHDLKLIEGKQQVVPADYETNLRKLVARMKQTGATLIWCSTTPVPESELILLRKFHDVIDYNTLAAKVMSEEKVLTNDLYGFAKPQQSEIQNRDDVHFSAQGSRVLAEKVAKEILGALIVRKKEGEKERGSEGEAKTSSLSPSPRRGGSGMGGNSDPAVNSQKAIASHQSPLPIKGREKKAWNA